MSLKVLIVDDSLVIRDLLRRTLEKLGYTVCGEARDGREGIEMFKTFAPDVVFMDISMPIIDGLEATESIINFNPNAKIIILSSTGDEETILKAKNLGVSGFLKKPFDDSDIKNVISSII